MGLGTSMQQINFQEPVKADKTVDGSLLVHSVFKTIQGEGPNVGQPSIFIRLAGCNLQCPGCDTEYTGESLSRDTLFELMTRVLAASNSMQKKPLLVITGGEPLRQNLVPFINLAIDHSYKVQIETNGTLGFDRVTTLSKFAWQELEIVCSPKAGKVHETLWPFIVAYKYVANAGGLDPNDGLPTTVLGLPGRPARPHDGYEHDVYLQPADENDVVLNRRNTDAVIASCQRFGHRLCLQTHKFIFLP
jgi:7-carboxy-7-deazaguanine synthase